MWRPLQALTPTPKCSAIPGVPASASGPKRENRKHHLSRRVSDQSKYDVCEVFSPPRVFATAIRHGLRGGWPIGMAFRDPSKGRQYDLRNSKDQGEVTRLIRRHCPTVLVVSPPCTAFSIANQGEVDKLVLAGAIEMIRFSIEICELQHKSGRHFIFEQPQSSRAWSLNEVVKLTYCDGVAKTTFHQCMYGLEARDHEWGRPGV